MRATADAWRTLPLETGEAAALLARSAALLDALAEDPTPVLRWYRAATPALVIGRGQRLPEPPAVAPSAGSAPAVVRRDSGGGAVLLDESVLCLDVALPAAHPLAAGEPMAAFDRVGARWAAALRELGIHDVQVHPTAASAGPRALAVVCFAVAGRGEVLVGGRKLVGLSQRRRRAGSLVQCALLRRWQPAALLEALGPQAPAADAVAERAVGLDELPGGREIDDATLIAAVSANLRAAG